MYRARVHFFPKTMEAFREAMMVGEEYNKLAADKGWAQVEAWVPMVGENELVAEFEYPDLATYERQEAEQFADPAAMALMGKLMEMEGTRSPYSELLNTAPSFG